VAVTIPVIRVEVAMCDRFTMPASPATERRVRRCARSDRLHRLPDLDQPHPHSIDGEPIRKTAMPEVASDGVGCVDDVGEALGRGPPAWFDQQARDWCRPSLPAWGGES
jgi:hypothetical protein